jgi:hypothetical protein
MGAYEIPLSVSGSQASIPHESCDFVVLHRCSHVGHPGEVRSGGTPRHAATHEGSPAIRSGSIITIEE